MAAGAYKSLTIRIGGDTTKLSSALRGANSAIYKTQTELNKLSKAAKLDPGNTNIAKAQFGAFAEQATNSAKKIEYLKAGIDKLGQVKVLDSDGKATDQTIAELAEGTDAVRLKAAEANVEYERINDPLIGPTRKSRRSPALTLRRRHVRTSSAWGFGQQRSKRPSWAST